MRQGRSLAVQPDCLKGRVVCGTVYGNMHFKDILGSFARVGYCIPVLDFYLVLHGLRCRKSTVINYSINPPHAVPFTCGRRSRCCVDAPGPACGRSSDSSSARVDAAPHQYASCAAHSPCDSQNSEEKLHNDYLITVQDMKTDKIHVHCMKKYEKNKRTD